MAPTIIIDYNETYIAANYMYVAAFGKYYFCKPPKIQTGKRIIFECVEDFLMTYKDELLNVPCTITRSESIGKPTSVPDPELPIDPNRFELKSIPFRIGGYGNIREFPLDVNSTNFILLTR